MDKTAYTRLVDFLELKDDGQLHEGKLLDKIHGNISVKDLSFRYDDRIILEELSLSIRSGEKVAAENQH